MRISNKSSISEDIILVRAKSMLFPNLGRNWYNYSRNKLSIVGLVIIVGIIISAIFAPWITPYPEHAGTFVDFENAQQAPSLKHLCGTDTIGRDIFSRIIFAFRGALVMSVIVLSLAVPLGVFLGLMAGFFHNTLIDNVIMRITDIFIGLPPLVLTLAIAAVLEPNLMNAMIAVTVSWWPWYTRLTYGMVSSVRNEYYVIAADLTGASKFYILFREILPNCISPILTKMALDAGGVILLGASLSFVGLGEQPPTPALGQMVSDGARFLPTLWWMSIFPALAIVFVIMSFNLVGDGIRDMLETGGG